MSGRVEQKVQHVPDPVTAPSQTGGLVAGVPSGGTIAGLAPRMKFVPTQPPVRRLHIASTSGSAGRVSLSHNVELVLAARQQGERQAPIGTVRLSRADNEHNIQLVRRVRLEALLAPQLAWIKTLSLREATAVFSEQEILESGRALRAGLMRAPEGAALGSETVLKRACWQRIREMFPEALWAFSAQTIREPQIIDVTKLLRDCRVRGHMAVHRSIELANLDRLRRLTELGCNLNTRYRLRAPETVAQLPLERACGLPLEAARAVVSLLLEKGANPNGRTAEGDPVLTVALDRSLSLAKQLLDAGATVDLRKWQGGQTPLMHVCAAPKGRAAAVELLLEYKAELNATDQIGFTALDYALFCRNVEQFELLLKLGAKSFRDKAGQQPEAAGAGAAAGQSVWHAPAVTQFEIVSDKSAVGLHSNSNTRGDHGQ
jgi:uncharacterized protein